MRCFMCQREVIEFYLAERLFHGPVAICTNCFPANASQIYSNIVYDECRNFRYLIRRDERNKKIADINWIKSMLKVHNFNWAYSSNYYDSSHALDIMLTLERSLNDLPKSLLERPERKIIYYGAPFLKEGDKDFNKDTFANPDLIQARHKLLLQYSKCYEWYKSELNEELEYTRNGYPYASVEAAIRKRIEWVESSIERLSDAEQYICVGAKNSKSNTNGLIESL